MNPWTDLDALCAAIRRTKNKGEAAALIATWRSPARAKQLPLRLAPPPTAPENDTMTPEEQVAAGRAAIRAIEASAGKAATR